MRLPSYLTSSVQSGPTGTDHAATGLQYLNFCTESAVQARRDTIEIRTKFFDLVVQFDDFHHVGVGEHAIGAVGFAIQPNGAGGEELTEAVIDLRLGTSIMNARSAALIGVRSVSMTQIVDRISVVISRASRIRATTAAGRSCGPGGPQ